MPRLNKTKTPQAKKTASQIRRTIQNVSRLRSILKVLAKHGFQDVLQRSQLASYLPGVLGKSEVTSFNIAQRMRMCMEELGPTFIKLGQLLASRPDIVPASYIEEFKKLQDQVPSLPFEKIKSGLDEQYPQGLDKVFSYINESPIGSASIAQVHRATLLTGEEVVLKIQKPGIQKTIKEDMNVLFFVAEFIDRSIPELHLFNPLGLVEEFSYAIEMETNFVVEANNLRRFRENFKTNQTIKIPKPFIELSGPQVLVLEYLKGKTLSEMLQNQAAFDREKLMKDGLQAYFAMVFKDGLFHGDLHPGNILVLNDGLLAFIDFGMVGRLTKRTQTSIANMFLAIANEDYDRLAYEYIELSSQSIDVDREEFSRDLRLLLSPFFGLNLKNVNIGKLLIDSAGIAFKHQVYLPSELLLFFKSIVTIEGLGRTLKEDFDLLPYVYDFSSEIVKLKYDPGLIANDLGAFSREYSSLVRVLPAEIKNYLRKMNSSGYSKTIEIKDFDDLQSTVLQGSRLLFFSIIIASLIVAGAMCSGQQGMEDYYGLSLLSWILFSAAGVLGAFAYFRIK